MSSDGKRASGGKRAGDARRARRAAAEARRAGYADEQVAAYREFCGGPPSHVRDGYQWAVRVLAHAIDEAMTDPGLPPERRREQMGRLMGAFVKALDPAQHAVRIEALEAEIERLMETRHNAGAVEGREASEPRETATIS